MSLARSLLRQSDRTFRGSSFITTGPGRVAPGITPPHGIPDYTFPMATRKIDSNSTAINVVNSSVETTIVDVSAPALTIRNEGGTRLMASGTITNTLVAGGTVTFKVKVADTSGTSVVLATSAIVCSTDVDTRKWALEAIMFGNATNLQTHWGVLDVSVATAVTMPASTFQSVGYSGSSLDETDPLNVTVTAQLSVASTGFNVVGESAIFEAIT